MTCLPLKVEFVHNYNSGYIVFTFKNGTRGFLDHCTNTLNKLGVKIVTEFDESKNKSKV